jgi:hypothetical protein
VKSAATSSARAMPRCRCAGRPQRCASQPGAPADCRPGPSCAAPRRPTGTPAAARYACACCQYWTGPQKLAARTAARSFNHHAGHVNARALSNSTLLDKSQHQVVGIPVVDCASVNRMRCASPKGFAPERRRASEPWKKR